MNDDVKPVVWFNEQSSNQPVLQLSNEDNVAVALRALKAGEQIGDVTLSQAVPKGHKLALSSIDAGARIIKYAQTIGVAHQAIRHPKLFGRYQQC